MYVLEKLKFKRLVLRSFKTPAFDNNNELATGQIKYYLDALEVCYHSYAEVLEEFPSLKMAFHLQVMVAAASFAWDPCLRMDQKNWYAPLAYFPQLPTVDHWGC